MNKRNTTLEFWRFVFCIAVLGFHFFSKINMNYFHAGYLGVEFFFIVSGYFIGVYYERQQEEKEFRVRLKSVLMYAWTRLKRLYPLYLIALILMLIIKSILNGYGFRQMLELFRNCLAEFFLLQWSPLGNEVLISAGWFVPAVFFGGLVFVLLLAVIGKVGGFVAAPLISVLLYRYYFILIGKIDVIYQYHCILRGIAGIGAGVFIYFVCRYIQQISEKQNGEQDTLPNNNPEAQNHWQNCKKAANWMCLVLSNAIFLGTFIYTNYGRRSKWDFLIIFLYALSMLLLMLCKPKLPKKADKLFETMGKVTYPIYIFQMPIIELLLALL